MKNFGGIGDFTEEFVKRLHQDGVQSNWLVQTMRDRTNKYQHVARWQEVTQNPKVEEMQSLVNQNRKQKQESLEDVAGQQLQRPLERKEQRELHQDVAASTFVEHTEPLLSACSHNVTDFRSNTNND